MAEKNVKKVSTWKLLLVLMVVVWMINLVMSFAFMSHPTLLGLTWLTGIIISLFQTVIVTLICYFFYVLFFRKGKDEKSEEDE